VTAMLANIIPVLIIGVIIVPVITLLIMFGIVMVVTAIKDAIAEERSRQRVASAMAMATSRLRRLEHDAMRKMHNVSESFLDVDGEEN
jgi:sensor domain CHASE-containing protein